MGNKRVPSGYTGKRTVNWKGVAAVACLVGVVVMVLCTNLGIRLIVVSGDSMSPTYESGEVLVAIPPTYVGDDYPVCWLKIGDSNVIKRLIGYPGDVVELRDGDTYVNGEIIMERDSEFYDNVTFELGDDQYIFLGDNRDNSIDSRYWASPYVSSSQIMGVVPNSGLGKGGVK